MSGSGSFGIGTMSSEIEYSKGTNVTDALDVDCKLPEEIDNRPGARRKREEQDEGSQKDGEKFLEEDTDFHRKQRPKFLVHLSTSVHDIVLLSKV